MPRTKLQSRVTAIKRPCVPPPNYIAELMRRYSKAQHMNSERVGEALGVSGSAVRHMLNRPASAWKVEELKSYCVVLNIPFADAMQAVAKSMEVCM